MKVKSFSERIFFRLHAAYNTLYSSGAINQEIHLKKKVTFKYILFLLLRLFLLGFHNAFKIFATGACTNSSTRGENFTQIQHYFDGKYFRFVHHCISPLLKLVVLVFLLSKTMFINANTKNVFIFLSYMHVMFHTRMY